jgi:hypothetical protein
MDRRCYEVMGYWPPSIREDGTLTHCGRHVAGYAVASSALGAARLVESRYPGIRIDQILHKGHRELFIEEEPSNAG